MELLLYISYILPYTKLSSIWHDKQAWENNLSRIKLFMEYIFLHVSVSVLYFFHVNNSSRLQLEWVILENAKNPNKTWSAIWTLQTNVYIIYKKQKKKKAYNYKAKYHCMTWRAEQTIVKIITIPPYQRPTAVSPPLIVQQHWNGNNQRKVGHLTNSSQNPTASCMLLQCISHREIILYSASGCVRYILF